MSVANLLASLNASLTSAFSDKTTTVGALSAAQAGFDASAATSAQRTKTTHQASAPFAVTLAKASLPKAATPPGTIAAKGLAIYAAGTASRTAA